MGRGREPITKELIVNSYKNKIEKKIAYWRRKVEYAQKRISKLSQELYDLEQEYKKEWGQRELPPELVKLIADYLERNQL